MLNKKALILTVGSIALASLIGAGAVLAQDTNNPARGGVQGRGNILKNINVKKIPPVVTGKVASIDGTNLTITSTLGYVPGSATSPLAATTYTVDASKATIKKISFVKMTPPAPETNQNVNANTNANANANANANMPSALSGKRPNIASLAGLFKNSVTTIAVADINVGDTLIVTGTVNGTTISATAISVTPTFTNAGENNPRNGMIEGAVQAIVGSTLTVAVSSADASAVIYSVDVSSATIKKIAAPAAGLNGNVNAADGKKSRTYTDIKVADIAVNDMVSVSGLISGTNIKANNIVDGVFAPKIGNGTPGKEMLNGAAGRVMPKTNVAPNKGIIGKIMDFFGGLFGKKK